MVLWNFSCFSLSPIRGRPLSTEAENRKHTVFDTAIRGPLNANVTIARTEACYINRGSKLLVESIQITSTPDLHDSLQSHFSPWKTFDNDN